MGPYSCFPKGVKQWFYCFYCFTNNVGNPLTIYGTN